jgi:hypothetical protein
LAVDFGRERNAGGLEEDDFESFSKLACDEGWPKFEETKN